MKISITGHNKGIGKVLHDMLVKEGHAVSGYDITNGYDLSTLSVANDVLTLSDECDIFINNAYVPYIQTYMLKEMISKWKDTNKLIINISSKMVFYDVENSDFVGYKENKKTQNDVVKKHIRQKLPHVLNIISGLVDTDLTARWTNTTKINPKDLSELVNILIKLRDKILVQEIIIDSPI
jgi:hypothetical protein